MDGDEVKALAELGKSVVDAARDAGGYVSRVLGTLPEDLVGLAIGDHVRAARWENAQRLARGVKARLEARGVQQTEKLGPSMAAELLDAAADENREELSDLWARLLANALDPSRSSRVRRIYIDIIKQLEPIDALVLQELTGPLISITPDKRTFIAGRLGLSGADIEVSFHQLIELHLAVPASAVTPGAYIPYASVTITSLGNLFLRAVEP